MSVEGNRVFLQLEFFTDAASGQNMVTIATAAACAWIEQHAPVKPEYSFVEANFSGDKKACALSFATVRGKKVVAEIVLPADLVSRRLHSTPKRMEQFSRMAATGAMMSGALGVQGHYANGLAALYLGPETIKQMPEQQDGLLWGFQLWINLPARDKLGDGTARGSINGVDWRMRVVEIPRPVVEGAQPVPWAAFRIVVDFATADGMTSRVETLRLGKAVTR